MYCGYCGLIRVPRRARTKFTDNREFDGILRSTQHRVLFSGAAAQSNDPCDKPCVPVRVAVTPNCLGGRRPTERATRDTARGTRLYGFHSWKHYVTTVAGSGFLAASVLGLHWKRKRDRTLSSPVP